jgi:hypothetical protein
MGKFDGRKWATNGPHMVSRIFHEHCKLPTDDISKGFHCDALDMQILPIKKAYAIGWRLRDVTKFFNPNVTDKVLKLVRKSHFVHFSSSQTKKMKVTKNKELNDSI